MSVEVSILMDFVSSLALVAMLALGYGALRRRFPGGHVAPMLLGLFFGIVTVIQMHRPLTLMDGLIVDLRNIPIALAGAFLGVRGLAICLLIAVATRYTIGGIGWVAGVWGMVLAGGTGLIWAHLTRHLDRRGPALLLVLALAMCSHLLAAAVLPAEIAIQFLSVAGVPIVALNLLCVPLVAGLLEREGAILRGEVRLQAAATTDPETGLMTQAGFAREVALASASAPDDPIRTVLTARLRDAHWLKGHIGGKGYAQLVGALRHRVNALIRHGQIIGQADDGRILIPLTESERQNLDAIATDLRRNLSEQAIKLPDSSTARATLDCTALDVKTAQDVVALLAQPNAGTRISVKKAGQARSGSNNPFGRRDLHGALFAKSERLRRAIHG